jgi:hypothetical protein
LSEKKEDKWNLNKVKTSMEDAGKKTEEKSKDVFHGMEDKAKKLKK